MSNNMKLAYSIVKETPTSTMLYLYSSKEGQEKFEKDADIEHEIISRGELEISAQSFAVMKTLLDLSDVFNGEQVVQHLLDELASEAFKAGVASAGQRNKKRKR